MKNTSPELRAHLDGDVMRVCTCWTITRVDGEVFRLTDNVDDVIFEGETYSAQDPYNRTAIAADIDLSVDNMDIYGLLNTDLINPDDMQRGKFDWAKVEIFLVNYEHPEWGKMILRTGWFGEIKLMPSGGAYQTELRGLLQKLDASLDIKTSPDCRAHLGDSKCKIEIDVPEVARDTAYEVGDLVRGRSIQLGDPQFIQVLTNRDFALDHNGEPVGVSQRYINGSLSEPAPAGWFPGAAAETGLFTATSAADEASLPDEALFYLRSDFDSWTIANTVPIITEDVTLADLQYGQTVMNASYYIRWRSTTHTARVLIEYLDAADAVIATALDTTAQTRAQAGVENSTDFFKFNHFGLAVPATATQVRFTFEAARNGGGVSLIDFALPRNDVIVLKETPSILDYQGRVHRCTTAGTTASSIAPDHYNETIDASTTDGTAVFQTEQAYRVAGFVAVDDDPQNFLAVIYGDERADNDTGNEWFQHGVIEFTTGKNAGRSFEVKEAKFDGEYAYDVEFWLEAPEPPAPGDIFWIHAGCDWKRSTCRDKFQNILNFRGEPDLPGQDEIDQFHATP